MQVKLHAKPVWNPYFCYRNKSHSSISSKHTNNPMPSPQPATVSCVL